MLTFFSLAGTGKDRIGWQQIVEIADYAREIEKKRRSLIVDSGERSQEMARAISYTLLGLFTLCT